MARLFIIFFVIECFSLTVFSQSKNEDIRKQIRLTDSLLQSYRKDEQTSVYELKILNKKISQQKQLINSLGSEISQLNDAIERTKDSIAKTKKKYKRIKEEYSSLMKFSYLNQVRLKPVIYIFSSSTFNEAYKRFLFIKNYSSRRKKYFRLLKESHQRLQKQKKVISRKIDKKKQLRSRKKQQFENLKNQYAQKEDLLADLRNKEAEIREKLQEQIQVAERLDKKIAASIREKVKREESESSYNIDASKSEKSLNFEKRKGYYKWPVTKGVVINYFGDHKHSFVKDTQVTNSGIDISTNKNDNVYAISSGLVVKVVQITGINYSVLVKHGQYYTLYANLQSVNVAEGNTVSSRTNLGEVGSDFQDDNLYYLKFQVWYRNRKLDPLNWLKEK